MSVKLDKETAQRMGRATILVEGMTGSGATGWYRRRFPRGSEGKGGFDTGFGGTVDLQACLICGPIPAASTTVDASGSTITGLTRVVGAETPPAKSVYPMRIDKSGWVNGAPIEPPNFIHETDEDDEILKMEGWNYFEEFPLNGGDGKEQVEDVEGTPTPTGVFNDRPIWGLGYKTYRLEENEDPEAEEEYVKVPAFAIIFANNPLIIYEAVLAQAMAASDSSVRVESTADIWGKMPEGFTLAENIHNWFANSGATATIVRGHSRSTIVNVDGVCEDDFEPDPPPEEE